MPSKWQICYFPLWKMSRFLYWFPTRFLCRCDWKKIYWLSQPQAHWFQVNYLNSKIWLISVWSWNSMVVALLFTYVMLDQNTPISHHKEANLFNYGCIDGTVTNSFTKWFVFILALWVLSSWQGLWTALRLASRLRGICAASARRLRGIFAASSRRIRSTFALSSQSFVRVLAAR